MRIFREPFFVFFVLALAIFGWFQWLNPPDETVDRSGQIIVDDQDIVRFQERFEATWRRPPTETELQGLVDGLIREEVLIREARQLGLDEGDAIIRRRLVQKMEFLTTSVAQSMDPGDEVLTAHMEANEERFSTPPRIAFEQILLRPDEDAGDVVRALNAGTNPNELGATTLLPPAFPPSVEAAVDGTLGRGAFSQLAEQPQGEWSGPVRSGYGSHVVRVVERIEGEVPPLGDVREKVLQDWRSKQSTSLTNAQVAALKEDYEIIVPESFDATGGVSQ